MEQRWGLGVNVDALYHMTCQVLTHTLDSCSDSAYNIIRHQSSSGYEARFCFFHLISSNLLAYSSLPGSVSQIATVQAAQQLVQKVLLFRSRPSKFAFLNKSLHSSDYRNESRFHKQLIVAITSYGNIGPTPNTIRRTRVGRPYNRSLSRSSL